MKNQKYEVIVGNIGCVYQGTDVKEAGNIWQEYADQSANNYGRASGEDVTLMRDGEPLAEYFGTNNN